jgi:hypothetical protein
VFFVANPSAFFATFAVRTKHIFSVFPGPSRRLPHSPLHSDPLRADLSVVSCLFRLIACLRPGGRFGVRRRGAIVVAFALSISASGSDGSTASGAATFRDHSHDGVRWFQREMPLTIRADHPAIVPVAAAIRAITGKPLEQIAMVNDVTHLLVDYDSDKRVYGMPECQATLDEMIARRREAGGFICATIATAARCSRPTFLPRLAFRGGSKRRTGRRTPGSSLASTALITICFPPAIPVPRKRS